MRCDCYLEGYVLVRQTLKRRSLSETYAVSPSLLVAFSYSGGEGGEREGRSERGEGWGKEKETEQRRKLREEDKRVCANTRILVTESKLFAQVRDSGSVHMPPLSRALPVCIARQFTK